MWQMDKIKLTKLFRKYPAIKLAYLFGSRADGSSGPMSDYDFGFYLKEMDPKKRFDLKLRVMADLGKMLQTDAVDVVILNDTYNTELKYNIVHDGKLLYSQGSFQLEVEPKILNEYFDFRFTMQKYGLTREKDHLENYDELVEKIRK